MTGHECYRRLLKGEAPDFLPRVPILMHFAADYIGSDYGAFASDYRVLVEANLRCAEDFGFDQVSAISDPYRETQGFGAEIVFVKDGVPRCPNPPLESARDVSLLAKPDPRSSPRMLDRVRAVEEFRRRCAGVYSILGWVEGPAAEAADLRGVGNFLMDVMDDEQFAAALMDRCLETAIAFAQAQIAAGADTIGIGDAIVSQMPPDIYLRLIQPREKLLVQAVQRLGAAAKLHICGNITHLLPGIAGLGVDILDVDHMVDLAEVRRRVGARVALAGNLDPSADMMRGTPEGIRRRLHAARGSAGDPFMPMAGCEIPLGTPHANLRALCEPMPY